MTLGRAETGSGKCCSHCTKTPVYS